jgi:hypothetical protein
MANLRDFSLNFVGGDEHTLTVDGDFFRIISGAGPLLLSFDNGPFVTRVPGQTQKTRQAFNRVRIQSPVPQAVVLACGFDELIDSVPVINGLTVQATIAGGNQNISLPAVVVGAGQTLLIAAANIKRLQLFVQGSFANDPATIPLIGGIDVDAAKGIECMAGAGLPPLGTTAAVYCHNPGAADITIRCMEVNKL